MNMLTLLEWNLHKMTHSAPVPPFVCRRILSPDPDLICLVEYRAAETLGDSGGGCGLLRLHV